MSNAPVCYGKSWDPKAAECAGGLDPMYNNPRDGSHRRDKCNWYTSCAARTCASTMGSPSAPGQLVGQPGSPQYAAQPVRLPVQQTPRYQHPQYQPQQQTPQYAPPPPQAYPYYTHTPQNYQQPGMQVLGYLSVPEPIDMGLPWYKRLGFEMIRSALKGLFHTGANFFDHFPFSRSPAPPPQQR